jgi:hypothetical protein
MEFVGSRQVQRIKRPWITGTGDVRKAMEENASWITYWLVFSRTVGSSEYRRDPVTMMAQKRNGDSS